MRASDIETAGNRFPDKDNSDRGVRESVWHGIARGISHFLVYCEGPNEARGAIDKIYQEEVLAGRVLPADVAVLIVPSAGVNKELEGILGSFRRVVEVPNVITAIARPQSLIVESLEDVILPKK